MSRPRCAVRSWIFRPGSHSTCPSLSSCGAAILLARGVEGCPAQSEIGSGHAVVIANLGVQPIAEHVTLWAFLGPPRNLQPTFEILGEGYTPLSVKMVLPATAFPGHAPMGKTWRCRSRRSQRCPVMSRMPRWSASRSRLAPARGTADNDRPPSPCPLTAPVGACRSRPRSPMPTAPTTAPRHDSLPDMSVQQEKGASNV